MDVRFHFSEDQPRRLPPVVPDVCAALEVVSPVVERDIRLPRILDVHCLGREPRGFGVSGAVVGSDLVQLDVPDCVEAHGSARVNREVRLIAAQTFFKNEIVNAGAKRGDALQESAFSDALVLKGMLWAYAYEKGLYTPPKGRERQWKAILTAAEKDASYVIWGDTPFIERNWSVDRTERKIKTVSTPWAEGPLAMLGFAVVSGFCRAKKIVPHELPKVAAHDIVRAWLSGDIRPAPEGPGRRLVTVPACSSWPLLVAMPGRA